MVMASGYGQWLWPVVITAGPGGRSAHAPEVLGKGTITIATRSGIRAYPAGETIGLHLTAPAVSSLIESSSTQRHAA